MCTQFFSFTPLWVVYSYFGPSLTSFIVADCCYNYSAHDEENLKRNHAKACTNTEIIQLLYCVSEGPLNGCSLFQLTQLRKMNEIASLNSGKHNENKMGMSCGRQLGASLFLVFEHEILRRSKQVDKQTGGPSVLLQMNSQNRWQNNGRVDEALSSRRNNGSSISSLTDIYSLLACVGNVLFVAFNFVTIALFILHKLQMQTSKWRCSQFIVLLISKIRNSGLKTEKRHV